VEMLHLQAQQIDINEFRLTLKLNTQ